MGRVLLRLSLGSLQNLAATFSVAPSLAIVRQTGSSCAFSLTSVKRLRRRETLHRSHVRGVKLIGATAHFVTENLDEGQITAQDVLPVDHKATPDDLVIAGRDVEARVLAHAIKMFSEQRILLNDGKTVVFT